MSGFYNDTNHGRVTKMKDMLGVLQKSARSNKATGEDWAALLQPVTQFISEVTEGASADFRGRVYPAVAEGIDAPIEGHTRASKEPGWVSIRKAAEEAPLADLTYAMAVYLSRIDEHLKG